MLLLFVVSTFLLLVFIIPDWVFLYFSKVVSLLIIFAGFCIKTKEMIDYNVLKPIDKSVYAYNDKNRSWKYCHKCGKDSEVTITDPLCDEHK